MTDEAVTNTRFYEGLPLPIDDPLYSGAALLLLHLDLALRHLPRRLLHLIRAQVDPAPTSADSSPQAWPELFFIVLSSRLQALYMC
jgi:hypothetical protein